jgi:hypothetical protein
LLIYHKANIGRAKDTAQGVKHGSLRTTPGGYLLLSVAPELCLAACAEHDRNSTPAERSRPWKTHHYLACAAREGRHTRVCGVCKFVQDGLRREGFQIVPAGEPADLVAFFGYGIDQGRDELYSYAIPQFGQTGVQSSQTFGTVQSHGSGATYSGTTTYTPSYGITGWTPQTGTRRLYTRAIVLHVYDISRGGEPRKLYESTVTSQGSSGTLGKVIDEIVAALFEDFQATGVRTAVIPLSPD